MNIELNESEYSASATVKSDSVSVDYVLVTVAGVSFDIVNMMPSEVWDALGKKFNEKYAEAGGLEEDLKQRKEDWQFKQGKGE